MKAREELSRRPLLSLTHSLFDKLEHLNRDVSLRYQFSDYRKEKRLDYKHRQWSLSHTET